MQGSGKLVVRGTDIESLDDVDSSGLGCDIIFILALINVTSLIRFLILVDGLDWTSVTFRSSHPRNATGKSLAAGIPCHTGSQGLIGLDWMKGQGSLRT